MLTQETIDLATKLSVRGYTAVASLSGPKQIACIKFSREANPNQNYGEMYLTESGWNLGDLSVDRSFTRFIRSQIEENRAATLATDATNEKYDRGNSGGPDAL